MGASQMRQILNRDRNCRRYLEKMKDFVPIGADDEPGISESELYERYRNSISRQLAA